jgi:hypothetical protein
MTLNFKINVGAGLTTNQIDIYNTGLISVGSQFSTIPTLTPGSPAPTTADFFALFYDTDPSFSPIIATDYYFTPTEDEIIFIVPDYQTEPTAIALQLMPNSGENPGAFTATWSYQTDMPDYAGLPDDYSQGYPISGYSLNGGADSNLTFTDGSSQSFDYAFTGTPEPATWIEMIAGLLGVGFVLRRRPAKAASFA